MLKVGVVLSAPAALELVTRCLATFLQGFDLPDLGV
jgi:hypothetical protein